MVTLVTHAVENVDQVKVEVNLNPLAGAIHVDPQDLIALTDVTVCARATLRAPAATRAVLEPSHFKRTIHRAA